MGNHQDSNDAQGETVISRDWRKLKGPSLADVLTTSEGPRSPNISGRTLAVIAVIDESPGLILRDAITEVEVTLSTRSRVRFAKIGAALRCAPGSTNFARLLVFSWGLRRLTFNCQPGGETKRTKDKRSEERPEFSCKTMLLAEL
jgi:hypothetical protein